MVAEIIPPLHTHLNKQATSCLPQALKLEGMFSIKHIVYITSFSPIATILVPNKVVHFLSDISPHIVFLFQIPVAHLSYVMLNGKAIDRDDLHILITLKCFYIVKLE